MNKKCYGKGQMQLKRREKVHKDSKSPLHSLVLNRITNLLQKEVELTSEFKL